GAKSSPEKPILFALGQTSPPRGRLALPAIPAGHADMKFPAMLAVPLPFIPLAVIERAAGMLFRRMLQEHPALFERLGQYREKRFAFLPSDVPLVFLVEPSGPSIHV